MTLDWKVPGGEDCPSTDDVMQQVTKLVGAGKPDERTPIRARADVQKLDDGRFRVELTTITSGSEGHRVIEERSCKAMAEATAVILAWMVDPNAVEAPRPTAETKPEATARPAPARPEPSGPKLVIGARGLFDVGTLPDFAAGVGLDAGVRWPVFRVLIRGGLWPHQTTYAAQSPASGRAGAELGLFTIGVDACVTPLRWDVGACFGPELERLDGTGFGVSTPRTSGATWVSLGMGIDGRVPLVGPMGLSASVRVVVPTERETFGLDGVGPVHRPDVVAGRAAVGVDAVF